MSTIWLAAVGYWATMQAVPAPPCLPPYIDQHVLYYASGETDLDLDRAWQVRLAADYIDPGVGRVIVSARTDTEGSASANLALSRRRAEIVAAELARLGIPRSTIEIRASGETVLARPTSDGRAEALNRQVLITTGPIRPSTWEALKAFYCDGR